jgi:hypothetical protein
MSAYDQADFMLEILFPYFEHVLLQPHTLLPRYCGLYVVSEKGREVILSVEANAFSSLCPIHERYDLKGSVVGRVTREADRARDSASPPAPPPPPPRAVLRGTTSFVLHECRIS